MLSQSTYLAARIVAEPVEKHFALQTGKAREQDKQQMATVPPAAIIEAIIDAAFWASLRREEGHSPKISLAFLPPEHAGTPVLFAQPMLLSPSVLTKLSPGVERPGIHLGIWNENDQLYIWGTTMRIPNLCFVLDVSEPGLLVIKHRRFHGLGKFANVAVLVGDQVKIVDENAASNADCPDILKSLLGFTSFSPASESVNMLVQLAVSMRAHSNGGTLLIVPDSDESWKKSIIHPIKYSLAPSYAGLTELISRDQKERIESLWQGTLKAELESIAGLTAVDGATILTDQFRLVAFGAKIGRPEGNSRIEQVCFIEPIIGAEPMVVNPSQSGGTRHLSAAQFVHDQPKAVSLVASQDGNFTIFTWSKSKNMVMAHRIDTLLL